MTTHPARIGAVILAGGAVPSGLSTYCRHRALLRVGERYLLDYIIAALLETPSIAGIALVAPGEALAAFAEAPIRRVEAGDTLIANMQRGNAALAEIHPTHMVYLTGDIPLLTPASMEEFLQASLATGATLIYPIIPRAACDARFPGGKRTYVTIRDGVFTGGNAIVTKANFLEEKGDLIQRLYAGRKNPLQLAGLLGWGTVWRLLTGSLTLPYLEAVATRLLGAPACALITPHADLGFDVDKAEDLAVAEQALG